MYAQRPADVRQAVAEKRLGYDLFSQMQAVKVKALETNDFYGCKGGYTWLRSGISGHLGTLANNTKKGLMSGKRYWIFWSTNLDAVRIL